MNNLSTIQKREKLNEVRVAGEKSNGGDNHLYEIVGETNNKNLSVFIRFQRGARNLEESTHGVVDEDLLEIVRHRLQTFQQGELSTRENAVALTHIEEALMWLNRRVEDRIERNVLGTNNK